MRTSRPVPSTSPPLIGGRYRVESVLGTGATAAVYEVYDTAKQRIVALKRLLEQGVQDAQAARRFEREYHTLSQLVHPRIIEVYDYHADEQSPFYTMELLSGGDLRHRSPIAWRAACRLLCDVCSALALLHSRRLVHRDLTPRNVRCTEGGGAKLFDFGAMAPFGRNKHLVGTPPYVPPEALHGQVLDGQTDLFALGATLYFALTGQHAYPARTLSELTNVWQTPPPVPSHVVAGIPPALDDLVLALLSQARNERPLSAAEVMERLGAIAGHPIDEALVVSTAYLSTPTLVGRDDKLATFSRKLKNSFAKRGGALLVSGEPGTGHSRLLDAYSLEAKLAGALVLRADAGGATGESWSAATALCEQLYEQLPELTSTLLEPHLALLAPVMPELAKRVQAPLESLRPLAATTGEQAARARGEREAVLRDFLLAIAAQRTLVVLADDLDRIDEPSAALLALLAHRAEERSLLTVAAVPRESDPFGQPAVKLFASVAQAITLHNLDAPDMEQLVVSLFGDVPNVHWLADRIFGLTRGNPLLVMRVTQHLVDTGVCRYTAGTWMLPASLDSATLNSALRETLDPSLSEPALDFARALALTELPRVSLELAAKLWSHADAKQRHAELLELAAAQIVDLNETSVGLSRPSWKALLLAGLPEASRRALHLRIAAQCGSSPSDQFRAIHHLVRAGEVGRATDMLVRDVMHHRAAQIRDPARVFDYLLSLPSTWPETFHACIEACRGGHRPLRDLLTLQLGLVEYSTLATRTERECILSLAAQLRHDAGLDLIADYAGTVPAAELLTTALGAAQQRYERLPENERGFPLFESILFLGQLLTQAVGMAGRTLDRAFLRAMPSVAPLAVLSPALAVVQENLECSYELMCGYSHRALAGFLKIAKRLEEPDRAGIDDFHHVFMQLGILWAIGLIEANLGRPSAWERADAIAGHPLFAVNALRLRAIAAFSQGDRARAEEYRVQMELLQIQNSPPQLFEGASQMQWVFGYAAVSDLPRVKQYLAELESLAREHPGYVPTVHASHGAYQSLRGDFVKAEAELEESLTLMAAGTHPAWSFAAGSLIWAIARQHHYAEAVARGRELLASMHAVQLDGNTHTVLVPLAFAESRAGESEQALQHVTAAIEILSAEGGSGVLLGQAYEVRAYVALSLGDATGFEHYAALCGAQFRIGRHPPLLARHQKLMAAAREPRRGAAPAR